MAGREPKSRTARHVRGSTTGRPIMVLLEALGRRWMLRILWELHREDAAMSFRALQAASGGLSPSVLNERLRELRELGIVEAQADGYALSAAGRALAAPLVGLHGWAERHIGARKP